ncbi:MULTISPECIES: DUF805 domain-containing protein [unclassified Enterococcus]|uniref:DUF805 domain-containing protein n=1 Tax=unclassified Enterococcus TaxID=2608891 RepID=UPI0015580B2C|nr:MULTISPECIES: DUF805 domain-containing protein [unclassified Enterococcus]MBS7576920.1 DUF805 domain-containing protein [Enterococcus sp. MMGLQ5-2]MBS7584327.1 DUF805 domain-containing protein [Enterococcus sp. MMGLQ5-1]NPD12183.1 DUF805 domain-containing protein [Enterococcus sp. MMGLQ5-1]NPD36755.1 DUF805 domain-containing protein [Enterococcus sp. MMGLQ5-2]
MFKRSIDLYLKKYFDFKSETTLDEFYPVAIILVLINFIGEFLTRGTERLAIFPIDNIFGIVFGLISLFLLIPTLALLVRRFSNVGFSWRLFVVLLVLSVIPFIGWFARVIVILIVIQAAGFARNVHLNIGNTTWYKK